MDTFEQNRTGNSPPRLPAPRGTSSLSGQCSNRTRSRITKRQRAKPSQGPDNEKMERMKKIAELQNELYDRILIQYYTPLKLFVHAKDPKKVTLAEHTRLYKLGKLMETLSQSCQVQNKIVYWYSAISGELSNDFNNSLQRTLDDMEKATVDVNSHWNAQDDDSVQDSPSPAMKFGLDPVKSKSGASASVDMTTIEARITNLHSSLETALTSLKKLIHTAHTEQVPLSNLDLSESDLGMLLTKFPMPYLQQESEKAST